MTNESITREEAEKRLKDWADRIPSSAVHGTAQRALDILFPPFEPIGGEVIAVGNREDSEFYREYVGMAGDKYSCLLEGKPSGTHTWKFARPLTDKEKGL